MWHNVGILLRPPKVIAFILLSKVHRTTRARVAIVCGKEILLEQNWGESLWALPGGGIHKGEEPVAAAAREIKEELSLNVETNKLHYITTLSLKYYDAPLFLLQITQKPCIRNQKLEITASRWFTKDNLPPLDNEVKKLLTSLPSGIFL